MEAVDSPAHLKNALPFVGELRLVICAQGVSSHGVFVDVVVSGFAVF